jgi:anti-sigma B factor antagonist
MAINLEDRDGVGVVTLTGMLDAAAVEAVRTQFSAWWQNHPGIRHAVMDLGGVAFMDSTGLGALLGLLKRVAERGGDLRLARPQANVMLVLNITRANKIFGIHDTLDAALAAARRG